MPLIRKIVNKFRKKQTDYSSIESLRSRGVRIGENVDIINSNIEHCHGFLVTIGNNVTIESDTIIPVGCVIGNNVTIKKRVVLGRNNIIHDNCVLRGNTLIGDNNEFLPGCIIGFWPKDIGDHHYEGALKIGDNNFFGENTIINVGEKSGNIEEVLRSTSTYFDDMVNQSIAKATTAIEPLMIIFLGFVVGIVILSVLLPIISLMQSI